MNCCIAAYRLARAAVVDAGFQHDIDWQNGVHLERVTEQDFLREHAFVVCNSGMKASVVQGFWPDLRDAFSEWPSAAHVLAHRARARQDALRALNYPRKVDGMIAAAERVARMTWPNVHWAIQKRGLEFLVEFDFIGAITQYHLAKNLGLQVAKPDRHLVRIAAAFAEPDVQAFCARIAAETGDSVPVVDLVLWRFAASVRPGDYLAALAGAA